MSWRSTIRSSDPKPIVARARAWRPIRGAAAPALALGLALALGCARKEPAPGAGVDQGAPSADAGAIGSVAPAFAHSDLDGKTVQLSDFKGKVVIVDFWATWCPPCRAEVPDLVRLQSKYGDEGLAVVGLSLDAGGAKDVRPFADEFNVNYTMLIANDETASAYGGILGIPTTFVIDRQGRIAKRFIGLTEYKAFEEAIVPLLQVAS